MKKIKYIVLFLFVLICCGCSYKYASTTRSIRHSGFTLASSKFKCDTLFSKDQVLDPVKFYAGTYLITENGNLFETSLNKLYSNNMNCRKADIPVKVSAVYGANIVKGVDNKFYYLNASEGIPLYAEVPQTDDEYNLYKILLGESSILKAICVNSKSGIYYVLKTDGNVYQFNISKNNQNYNLDSVIKIYSSEDYGGRIVDFNYNGSSSTTFIKTETTFFRMLIENSEECYKYADVSCKYKMDIDRGLTDSYKRILAYNGSSLLSTYSKIFTVNN